MKKDYDILEIFIGLMIEQNQSLEKAEREYNEPHSTLHWFVHNKLKKRNPDLYEKAIDLFERHKR